MKAGEYYYINTKSLFDSIKLDYMKSNITFEIERTMVEKTEMFILKPTLKERKTDKDGE